MIEATPHKQEAERLASLKKIHLLDTPLEERFERITRLVCRLLDVPIALFNLIDEDRQHYKSVQGLPNYNAAKPAAFCTHAINEEEILLVPDTHKDNRFFDNPFVTGQYMEIGFYAGIPIRSPDGMPIGTLCAIDIKPRDMSVDQLNALRDLAAIVETELKVASLSRVQRNLIHELGEANRLAMIDPLTRLWNRQGMEELLQREWAEAARQGHPVTLVMADIDHFKKINDTFGHPAGDCVLKSVAKKLVESLRAEDAVGRMGGEEFLILLTGTAPEKTQDALERVRTNIATAPLIVAADHYPVTMSFGAATTVPQHGDKFDALIAKADEALYAAKNGGRNRVEIAA